MVIAAGEDVTESDTVSNVLPDTVDETQSVSEPANVWDRIREGFSIEYVEHPRIQQELNWYTSHPGYIQRVCERATPFMYDIVNVLEENNIPTEMALLPIVESAFQPFAYSPGRASGLWQFIPGTGKLLGLKQNWWYDGRRDPHESTRAAAEYLLQLNKMLKGDWLHSLAGYNAGPGNVRKAVRRNKRKNKPTDYWSLRLPKETEAYVPKLLALKKIVENPSQYGLELCHIPDQPATELVKLKGQLDLAIAADLAQMELDEIYALNAGFNRWATAPDGPHHLLLPLDRVDTFKLAESALPDDQRVRWKRHKVKSGETLGHIAMKHGTTVKEIKRSNNMRSTRIRIGQNLLIPTANRSQQAYTLSADQREESRLTATKSGKKKAIHIVQSGESWWLIAKKHQVSHKALAKWNGKSHLDTLNPGQKLVVWGSKNGSYSQNTPLSGPQVTQKMRYPVRRGDSLYKIAEKFNVGINDLIRWNSKLKQKKYLQPGQQLVIYVDVTQQSSGL